jgi:hypothetical protein
MAAVIGVVAIGLALSRSGYPAAEEPDDVVAVTVTPSTLRPGQPFIVIVRPGGERLADGSEVRWYRAPEVTWQTEQDGRWRERYILTMAARGHPPAALPGDLRLGHAALPLGPTASTTYEAPAVAPGTYRICAVLFAEPVAGTGNRVEHRSCTPVVVAGAVGTTS